MDTLLALLRKKPKHVKNLLAFSIACIVTGIIAGFWATSLPARFAQNVQPVLAPVPEDNSFSLYASKALQGVKHMFATVSTMHTDVTYSKNASSSQATNTPHMIDLNALLASSTVAGTSSMDTFKMATSGTSTRSVSARTLQ